MGEGQKGRKPKTLDVVVPDQIWEVKKDIKMLPGVRLPARMVVVRLDAERLALHSPVRIDEGLAAKLAEHGRVAVIIAPNNYHHLYLKQAAERYPEAEVWAAPGLTAKRQDMTLTNLLGPTAAPPWADALTPFFLAGGPKMDETVFIHRATRTLIVTDSYFNLTSAPTFMSRLLFRMTGSLNKPGQSRIWRMVVKDKQAMGESTKRLLAEDFDRLVVAHGDTVETGAHAAYEAAAAWLFKG